MTPDKQMIVGRIDECRELDLALQSPHAELIAVYGRRRVGKTFLIRQHYRKQLVFDTAGLHDGNAARQLMQFHASMQRAFPALVTGVPKNWLDAFLQLRQALERTHSRHKSKLVLFFDEFPWFDTRGSGFVAAFEAFWNQYASEQPGLVIVVCGSAAAWMVRRVIHARGGLHNRITRRIRLLPFTLGETAEFLEHRRVQLDILQVAQIYMAIGGIPHYLNHIRPGRPAGGNVMTHAVLQAINEIFPHSGPKVVYGEMSRLGASRLAAEGITFKQIPYDLKIR